MTTFAENVMTICEMAVNISLDDRHECEEGIAGLIRYSAPTATNPGRWVLKEYGDAYLTITHCPWCGEKLPEIVITPPEPTEEELRKWRKQMKKMARQVERWLEKSEGTHGNHSA